MRFAVALSLVTVFGAFILCQALDDDEDDDKRKFSVTFFQFNPKDLGILGSGHHKKDKRHVRRSDVEPKTNNHTTAGNIATNETAHEQLSNATLSNATLSNATSSLKTDNETAVAAVALNETKAAVPQNASAASNATTASTAEPTDDVNIMNALIDLAVSKNTSVAKNTNTSETHESSGNQTADAPLHAADNSTANSTAVKKSHIPKRDKVLDPNPKPSDQEAALNVKAPSQLENKDHSPLIHAENTSNTVASEDKHETTKNSVTMEKNETAAAPSEAPKVEAPKEEAPKDAPKEAPKNESTNADDEQKKKLLKDKETNKEIKEGAKNIKPVLNTVGDPNKELHDIMGSQQKGEIPVDEKTKKHRSDIAAFVPLYHSTTERDHKLSFQVGSMKHPKHNIHPKCHACGLNSTYKECVKKSTLKLCNEGLNNICFTKSTKKNGIVTYEMGCADHNNCVHAKAFPCNDGHDNCFTCCQFDRCNSSPHHGDYELDELNLDELSDSVSAASFTDSTTLDTKSASHETTAFWPVYLICLLVYVAVLHY